MLRSTFGKIVRLTGKAIGDFDLISHKDRILVALSGGKDSWSLLYALLELKQRAPISFEFQAVTIDPGFESEALDSLKKRTAHDNISHEVIVGNIVEVVNDYITPGTNPCSFCSRLRRGILYSHAISGGWTKLALGHHLDDFVETLLLNLFYNGSIKAMAPKLLADNGKVQLIRPLVYVRETLTDQFARDMDLPIFGCACAYQGMSSSRRQWVKAKLNEIEKEIPSVRSSLIASLRRVDTRHLFPKCLKSDS